MGEYPVTLSITIQIEYLKRVYVAQINHLLQIFAILTKILKEKISVPVIWWYKNAIEKIIIMN